MPRQVSWQSVSMKSHRPVHVLGAEAAVAAEAPVGTVSAAHASSSQQTPAAARITAAKMPSFCMRAPRLNIRYYEPVQVGRQHRVGAICSHARKLPIRVAAAPQSSYKANGFGGEQLLWGDGR